jgi:hypothetical protein
MRKPGIMRLVLAAAAIAFGLSAPAFAHHTYANFYDLCTSVSLSGQIERVQWKQPHVLIDLRTDAGEAYIAEWSAVANLNREKVSSDALKAGDHIVVTGSPKLPIEKVEPGYRYMVDPSQIVSALTEIRRPSDGWKWTRDPGPKPASCKN